MNNEELLRRRWKVIADYPKSVYNVGDILNGGWRSEDLIYCDTDGPRWSHYPHLFKELEWWEERAIEDLPDYVKYQKLIYKAKDKFLASVRCEPHPFDGKGLDADWGSCLPATDEEYLNQ